MSYVLGIDPSITATGICLIHNDKEPEYFTIGSKSGKCLAYRLEGLHEVLTSLIYFQQPLLVALETPISPLALKGGGGSGFNNNIMAYGVFYQILGNWSLPYVELSPHQLKMVATGKGNTKKEDVVNAYHHEMAGRWRNIQPPMANNNNEIDAYYLAMAAAEETAVHMSSPMSYGMRIFHPHGGWLELNDKTYTMLEGLEVQRP